MATISPIAELDTETAPGLQRSRRPLSRRVMHWVRRIHLFTGLLMFPWAMLYGITALLFNHPGAFPDQPQVVLSRDDFAGTALEQLADPAQEAERVVTALNAKRGPDVASQPPYRLVESSRAQFTRDVISGRARGPGQEHSVLLDLPSGTATVSTTRQDDADRAPFAVRGLRVPGSLGERVKASLPEALSRKGLSADDAGIAVGTEVVFFVEAEGRVWRTTFNIQTGAVNGGPAAAPSNLSVRKFLTQLHLSHGFPSVGWTRWLWAVAVDAMFASMVFWGISGLFMWWQIRAVRIAGAVLLSLSLILAALLACGMHGVLTAA